MRHKVRKNDMIVDELILTPVARDESIVGILGYKAYGIFKILEAKRTITLDYLVTFEIQGVYDGCKRNDELLLVYALLFGHCRAFTVECNDPDFFATVLLMAISSHGGVSIHNYLCRMGCYEE